MLLADVKPTAKPTPIAGVTMLTDASIRQAIKAGKNKTISDGKGKGVGRLVVMVRAMPSRTVAEFYAQQWAEGRKRLTKIGTFPATSLAQARETFETAFAPLIVRKHDIRVRRNVGKGSLRELFDAYIEDMRRRGCTSSVENEKQLARIVSAIGAEKPACEVTTDDIVFALRPVYARGSAGMANRFRSMVRAAFAYGIASENDYRTAASAKRFFLSVNPAASIPADMPKPGDRWLTVEELKAFWTWLQDPPVQYEFKKRIEPRNLAALKINCILGQRVTEICRIDTTVYDPFERMLDWSKTKNGLPHSVPLPRQAVDILETIGPNPQGIYFPQLTNERAFINQHLIKDIVRRYCLRERANWFSPRDLRRTWKTLAGSAGISKVDRDLLQNHKRSDVSARHYDRYEYLKEKRAAMDVWQAWFAANIER